MKNIKIGNKGNHVARVQALLTVQGFDTKPIDGHFGRGTERSVMRFQERRGIQPTGIVEEATQMALGMDQPDSTKIAVPIIDRVTVDIVSEMFSRHTPRRNIENYLPPVLDALAEARMDDLELVLMALATIRAETEGFEPISEKPSKYNTDKGSHPFNRYDDRSDLGNRGKPDGETFRGRGFIQLTGRSNYERYGKRIDYPLIVSPAGANDPQVAAKVLAAFLRDKQNRIKYALLGHDLATARRLVNGGSHGLDRFTDAYETGMRLLGDVQS